MTLSAVGAAVGFGVGGAVGLGVGGAVGFGVGAAVGFGVVGCGVIREDSLVGLVEGALEGLELGAAVGFGVGAGVLNEGALVGLVEGADEGLRDAPSGQRPSRRQALLHMPSTKPGWYEGLLHHRPKGKFRQAYLSRPTRCWKSRTI